MPSYDDELRRSQDIRRNVRNAHRNRQFVEYGLQALDGATEFYHKAPYIGGAAAAAYGAIRQSSTSDTRPRKNLRGMGKQVAVIPPDDDDKMDGGGENTVAAASAAGPSKGGAGMHETPVIYHSPTYGLPETHTTILPFTMYFSAVKFDWTSPAVFKLALTNPRSPAATVMAAPTFNAATIKGVYNARIPLSATDSAWPVSGDSMAFPVGASTIATAQNSAGRPMWFDYWAQFYQYYHVMECHYKITITQAMTNAERGAIVAYGYDNYGTTSVSNNIPETATLNETFSFPQVYHKVIPIRSEYINVETITGSYKPQQANKNVVNDSDIKNWTEIAAAGPNLTEHLKLMFYSSPNGIVGGRVNVQVQVKYITQFKDLFGTARYPANQTAYAITLPTDAVQKYQ